MRRVGWFLSILAALGGGVAAGVIPQHLLAPRQADVAQLEATITRLQHQVDRLQAELQVRNAELTALRQQQEGAPDSAVPVTAATAARRALPQVQEQGQKVEAQTPPEDQEQAPADEETPGPTVAAALERFYAYLDDTADLGWRARLQRGRALVAELRAMGDVAVEALLDVLREGSSSDERRAAAGLLGALQDPRALPALQEVREHEQDLMVRRAAARGLARLQVPETIPVLETLVTNPGEDRFVRLSAAYGLAQLGQEEGVHRLGEISEEARLDGQGQYLAFRALTSLNDARALQLMRQLVTSADEVLYRLEAIRFLADHGTQQDLPLLQQVTAEPTEQPSIREAAEQAYTAIRARK